MSDLRGMIGARPTGGQPITVVTGYVSANQPEPSSFDDPVYVVLPSRSTEVSTDLAWPAIHGQTMPVAGDVVVVIFDQNRVPHVAFWYDNYSEPIAQSVDDGDSDYSDLAPTNIELPVISG